MRMPGTRRNLLGTVLEWSKLEWPGLLAAGITLGFALWMNQDLGRRALVGDEPEYHQIAVNLASTGRFGTADRFPGYPLFVSMFYRLFGARPGVMRIPQAVLGALIVWLTWRLARRSRLGTIGSAIAMGLLFMDGFLIEFVVRRLYAEVLFIPILLGMILLYSAPRLSRSRFRQAGLGLLSGLTILTRGQGVFIVAAYAGVQILEQIRARRRPAGGVVWTVAFSVLFFLLWNVKIHSELGHWPLFTTGTGLVLYGSHCEEAYRDGFEMGRWILKAGIRAKNRLRSVGSEWDRNRILIHDAFRSIRSHSLLLNSKLLYNKLFWALYPTPGIPQHSPLWLKLPMLLIAWGTTLGFLLSLLLCPRPVSRHHLPAYLGMLAVVMLFYGQERIVFPIYPLMCIDSVRGWHAFLTRVRTGVAGYFSGAEKG